MATVRHLGLFPFCIRTVDVNPLTIDNNFFETDNDEGVGYGLGVDLDTLIKWYWRVKTWSFSASVTYESGEELETVSLQTTWPANNYKGFLAISTLEQLLRDVPKNETDLVCSRETRAQLPEPSNSDPFVIQNGWFYLSVEDILFYEGLYYPKIGATFEQTGLLSSEPNVNTPGGTVTLDGFSIPAYRRFSSDIDNSIVITPSEYWPYDPGDGGGPIYDSATGAQLRLFPS